MKFSAANRGNWGGRNISDIGNYSARVSLRAPVAPSSLIGNGHVDMPDHDLICELAERWAPRLKPVPWNQRILLLNDLHDFLRDTVENFDHLAELFPRIIAEILYRLGEPTIGSTEQARVYANSSDPGHRETASEWFRGARKQ